VGHTVPGVPGGFCIMHPALNVLTSAAGTVVSVHCPVAPLKSHVTLTLPLPPVLELPVTPVPVELDFDVVAPEVVAPVVVDVAVVPPWPAPDFELHPPANIGAIKTASSVTTDVRLR